MVNNFSALLIITIIFAITFDCINPVREEVKREFFFGVWEKVDSKPWMPVYVFSDTIYQHYAYSTTSELQKWFGDNFWKIWDINGSSIEITVYNGGKLFHKFKIVNDTTVIIDDDKFYKSNNRCRYIQNAL